MGRCLFDGHCFCRLLKECGMELVYKKRFADAISYYLEKQDGRALMGRMQALEPFPPTSDVRYCRLIYRNSLHFSTSLF